MNNFSVSILNFFTRNEKILKVLSILLLIFLVLIPRITEVLNRDYVFGFDQGRDYLAAWDIAVNHKLTLIGAELGAGVAGMGGMFHGPLHYYSLVVPFLFFGGDPYGGILLMFAFGMGASIAAFYLGKKLFNFWGAVFLTLLVAMSPQFINQSRFVWNSHPTTFFILLSFIFIYLMKDKKIKYTFLAALFTGLTYNFELAIAVPLTFTFLVYIVFVLKLRSIKHYIFLVLGLLIAYSPMILFEIRHHFMAISGLFSYTVGPKAVGPHTLSYYLLDHLNSFYYNFTDTFPIQHIISYYLLLVVIPLSIYFILKEKNSDLKKFLIFCLLLIPCNFLVFAFLKNSVYTYYLLDLNIAYMVLITYLAGKTISQKNIIPKIFVFGLISFFTITASISAVRTFTYDIKDVGGGAKIGGKKAAIDYIYKDANGQKFGLFIFTGPIYTYPFDYIITWYAADKYGYVPYKEKKGLVYLLIEVDTGHPHTYKGWLETVIKDGKILKTETLPSGFILQKRMFPK